MHVFLFDWIDPWGFLILASALCFLASVGVAPLDHKVDAVTHEIALVLMRRLALCIMIVLPIYAIVLVPIAAKYGLGQGMREWLLNRLSAYAVILVGAGCLGIILRIFWWRVLMPWSSALLRRWRSTQETDSKTDIRNETSRYQTREYDPHAYYTSKAAFVGLSEENKPLTLPWALLRETHMQVIGPTRYGKGVFIGSLLAQAIAQDWGCWYFDPKGDKHLPHILAEHAARHKKPFYVLDLVNCIGTYAPFSGGTEDERAQRIIAAFKLEGSGGDADFYKRSERAILRELCREKGAGLSLKQLRAEFAKRKRKKFEADQKRASGDTAIEDGLDEWDSLTMIAGAPTVTSLNVKKLLESGAVVYVRSRTKGLTVEVARTLLQELTETALRLPPEASGKHVIVAVDEARSMISSAVVDALTTVAGAGVSIILGYQSVLDVRNIDDQRLDKDAVESTVNVNCQIKLCHGTADFDTSEFISKLTGTKRVLVAQMESTEIGQFGGEKWGDKRSFREDEDQLISANTISALPPRVAVLCAPHRTAQLIWTCWLRYDQKYYIEFLKKQGVT